MPAKQFKRTVKGNCQACHPEFIEGYRSLFESSFGKLRMTIIKKPRLVQNETGLFQFGVILYQPSGMASKQKSFSKNPFYSGWRYRMTRAYRAICFCVISLRKLINP